MKRERSVWFLKYIFLPIALFTFLTFLIHPTIFTNFSTHIEKNDGRLLAWTLAWDAHKLLTDPLGIYEANIYYPNHNTLTYSEHLIGASYLSVPAYIVFNGNPAAMFNFIMILSYILNAFAAYWLCRYLTKNNLAAILGGIIYGYCSYKILNFGHLQNMIIFYIPFLMYFVMKYFETRKKKYMALSGLMLLVQSLTSWYHMVFIFLLFFLLILYYFYKRQITRKDIRNFIIMLIPVMLVILPFAIPYLNFNKESASAYTIKDVTTYSSDFGGYLFPSPNTLLNKVLNFFRITKESWHENFNYVGILPLVLLVISLFKIRLSKLGLSVEFKRSRIKYFLIGLVFVLFSFGPFLRIDDIITRIPMPYYLVYNLITPIRFIRAVARFATVVYLMLAILAAFGFIDLIKNRSRKFAYALFAILSLLIFADYYPFYRLEKYSDMSNTPSVYQYIRDTDEVKAIAELPIAVDPFTTTGYVYYAGIHFKPLLNGYSGYEPKSYGYYRDVLTNNPNTVGYLEMRNIGLTHILNNPTSTIELDSQLYEKVYDQEGYQLYKLKDAPSDFKFYYDNFSNPVNNGFNNVNYEFTDTQLNALSAGTPFTSLSPSQINKQSRFDVNSETEFSKIQISFRAYSDKDTIQINCGNYRQTFTNTSIYLDSSLEIDCGRKVRNFYIEMHSSEIHDRTLVKSFLIE